LLNLIITDKLLTVKFDNKSEETEIKSFFIYDDNSRAFSKSGFNQMYVKKVCFIKYLKKTDLYAGFAGLTKELLVYCREHNINFTLQDKRTHIKFEESDYEKYFPFEYNEHQIRALQAMTKTNRGIICCSTGGGKTEIFTAFIKLSKLKTLILVDKVTLAKQTQNRLIKEGIDCGLICGSSNLNKDVTVCTIQSIKKLDGREFECCICDEVHTARAKTFQDFFKISNFIYWYGFSATMPRDYLEYAKIRQFFGSIICNIESKELMQAEVIARPKIKFIDNECIPCMDFQSSYNLNIVNNKERNKKIAKIAKEYDNGVIILINIIDQAKNILEFINAEFISGDTKEEERQNILQKFENGEIKYLISSSILNTGINLKNIKVLINACGYKSNIQTLQKIGRLIRITDEKKQNGCFFYDFYDYGCVWLERHSKIRKSLYRKVDFDIEE
jgi:superfamily II DNA or RNA helicase